MNKNTFKEFSSLGFQKEERIVNNYGMIIYVGYDNSDDWALHIPTKIMKIIKKDYEKLLGNKGYTIYGLTKEQCFSIAESYLKVITI